MSSPIVTPGSVTSAAEAIVALGEKPTVDRIRAYLQGGSPNKILPLLRDWKAANQQPRTDTGAEQPHSAAPEPVREIVTLETLPEVTGAIEALTHAIQALPPGQRQAIELLKLRELSLKEAAERTGMTIGALKLATFRAMASLRRTLRRTS